MNAGNGTTVICTECGTRLPATADICLQCGGTIAKHQATESKEGLKQLLDRPWVIVVLILHVGFLGIPVYWKTNYSLGARLFMVVTSIVYTVSAVALLVLMLQWLIHRFIGG
ncbi:MAG: hypothetical protein HYV60_19355 [Planctomycetia bacterium]|nr:hypothetical protein [Planctomycetia bacterium]